eukprot:7781477-Prorocentrum_lima.AAC.1
MTSSLVGSEMCIRDRTWLAHNPAACYATPQVTCSALQGKACPPNSRRICLLYTSDAADDM